MAQQTPYIGSKISLISKLDIRYEGVLCSVDPIESTIALSNGSIFQTQLKRIFMEILVRSFGTEERQTTSPVTARGETYAFIIFKASDIKDLIVCESPKPQITQIAPLPYDPAIVSVSQQPSAAVPMINKPPVATKSNANAGHYNLCLWYFLRF